MAFRNSLREILVDDREVKIPEHVKASDVIRLVRKDPSRYDLVRAYSNGSVDIYPGGAEIWIREGFVFETQLTSTNG